jgi:hypothetical protein
MDGAPCAIDIVNRAADALHAIEDRAAESERRALAAEEAYVSLLKQTERRLAEASRSFEIAQKRIEALQARLLTSEHRARSAATETRETRHALAMLEEAIRSRLSLSA